MKTVQISLNSIDKVKSFVNDITKFDYDFDLVSGRYVIDAKSIMGIFSLDLSKPIDLNIHTEDNIDDVLKVLEPYICISSFRKVLKRHQINNVLRGQIPDQAFVLSFYTFASCNPSIGS